MTNSKHYLWSGLGQFGSQAIGLIGNILIARILMPADYGLIAMLAIIMGLAWNFTASGFADSLIRKKDADRLDFGTVATFNLSVSLIIYLIIFATAPYVSSFFQREELTGIARILGISIVIRAIALPAIVGLRKNLEFRTLALMHLSTSVLSLSLTYFMALKGYGYWALAAQPIFIALSNVFFVLIVARWKPYFCFRIERFKEMYKFGGNLLIAYITNQLGGNLYIAVIGKFYPVNALGFYRQAQKMEEAPVKGLNSVILTTSYSIIAKEPDLQKQRALYYNLFQKFVTIQSVMVLCLIGMADPLWNILLGAKWAPSIPFFQLFMLVALVMPLETVNSNIAKIHNRPALYRNLTFLRNGLRILALILLIRTDLITLLWGQIAAAYVSVLIDMYFCGRIIDFGIIKQLSLFLKIFIKPFIAFLLTSLAAEFINLNFMLSGICWFLTFSSLLVLIYILTKDELFFQSVQKLKYSNFKI